MCAGTLSYCLGPGPRRRPRYGRDRGPLSEGSWLCLCAPAFDRKKHNKKGKEPLGCEQNNIQGKKVSLVEGADVAGAPMPQYGFRASVSLNASLVSFPQKNRRITNGMNENIAFIALPLICHALILKPLDLDHFIHP